MGLVMDESGALPPFRAELMEGTPWGPLSAQLRRYELATPELPGPLLGQDPTFGCVHGARASLVVRIGGGHLWAPLEEILRRVPNEARGSSTLRIPVQSSASPVSSRGSNESNNVDCSKVHTPRR